MPKILTEQIKAINNACSNNWKLDTQYYLFHRRKATNEMYRHKRRKLLKIFNRL